MQSRIGLQGFMILKIEIFDIGHKMLTGTSVTQCL